MSTERTANTSKTNKKQHLEVSASTLDCSPIILEFYLLKLFQVQPVSDL